MLLIPIVAAACIATLTSYYLIPFLITVALKFGIVDKPDNLLKNHKMITPYLGGLGVYSGFIVALALFLPSNSQLFLFFIGTTLLLLVGLIDDLMMLNVQQKLLGQAIAAFCFLKAGLILRESFFSSGFNIVISFLWILTITNAFNLLDVMDGLATTIALGASITFLCCSLLLGAYDVALLLAAFTGGLLGFLYYNKPKAQIYLGDTGSLFIGGFLATIPFMLPWGTYNNLGFLTPLIILAIPLIEIVALIMIRSYKGIPFYRGSHDHLCHYMQRNHWSVYSILLFVASANLILSIIALLFVAHYLHYFTLAAVSLSFLFFWILVVYQKIPTYTQQNSF